MSGTRSGQPPKRRHNWDSRGRTASSEATTSWKWRQRRKQALQRDNFECVVPGCERDAYAVDKIIPRHLGGDPYDLDNLQSLCRQHHNAKTAKEASAAAAAKRAAPKPKRRSQIHPADLLRGEEQRPEPPRIDPWGAAPAGGAAAEADIVAADPTAKRPESRGGLETGRSGAKSTPEGGPE